MKITDEAVIETLAALGTDRKVTRVRRGHLVVIPERWRGQVPHAETVRKRPSKNLHKMRKWMKHGNYRPRPSERWADYMEDA